MTGFAVAYVIFDNPAAEQTHTSPVGNAVIEQNSAAANPFAVSVNNKPDAERLNHLEIELTQLKQQLQQVESTLQELLSTSKTGATSSTGTTSISSSKRYASALTQRLYNLDNLIRGGIDASAAEDIVRRKNSIELKRLQLQDLATREDYLNTALYFEQLEDINKLDISLREELGDERYDDYLFNSRQNNRIKISSVMLGSAAEQAGILKGDIVLDYDNRRMFSWSELKDATAQGELGEYVSISIYRNGEIFSFSVPRGALGMQLGSTRLEP